MQILISVTWLFSVVMSVVFLAYTFHQRGRGFKLSLRNQGTISDLAHTRVKKTFNLIFLFIACLNLFLPSHFGVRAIFGTIYFSRAY